MAKKNGKHPNVVYIGEEGSIVKAENDKVNKNDREYFQVCEVYEVSTRFVPVKSGNRSKDNGVVFQGKKPPKDSIALVVNEDGKCEKATWDNITELINVRTTEVWSVIPVQPVVVLSQVKSNQ